MKGMAYLRLARPGDWLKNLFVFPALLASGKIGEGEAVVSALIAFAAFSCAASGVYCFNDSLDWREDAKHPVKRHRPIAAGEISPMAGRVAGVVWIAAGIALSFLTLGGYRLAGLIAAYLVLQAAYNGWLKRMAMVDVVALSIGFVLRAWAGAVAIAVPASLWLLSCVFFLCLYLALIKRLCDLTSAARRAWSGGSVAAGGVGSNGNGGAVTDAAAAAVDRNIEGWHSAAGYRTPDDLNWMLGVSAGAAVLAFLMYCLSPHALEAAGPGVRGLAMLTPLVLIAIFRFYRAAMTGESDSPFAIVTWDAVVLACSTTFAVAAVVFLTVGPVEAWFARYFGS